MRIHRIRITDRIPAQTNNPIAPQGTRPGGTIQHTEKQTMTIAQQDAIDPQEAIHVQYTTGRLRKSTFEGRLKDYDK